MVITQFNAICVVFENPFIDIDAATDIAHRFNKLIASGDITIEELKDIFNDLLKDGAISAFPAKIKMILDSFLFCWEAGSDFFKAISSLETSIRDTRDGIESHYTRAINGITDMIRIMNNTINKGSTLSDDILVSDKIFIQ